MQLIKDDKFYDEMWNPITGSSALWPTSYAMAYCRRFCGDVRLNLSNEKAIIRFSKNCFELLRPIPSSVENHFIDCPLGANPTYHRYRLDKLSKYLTGRNILVGSLGEMFGYDIPETWWMQIFGRMLSNPQHKYIVLTAYPNNFVKFVERFPFYWDKERMMVAVSVSGTLFWDSDNLSKDIELIKKNGIRLCLYIDKDYIILLRRIEQIKKELLSQVDWIVIDKVKSEAYECKNILSEISEKFGIPVYINGENMPHAKPKELCVNVPSEARKRLLWAKCGGCGQEFEKKQMNTLGSYKKRGRGYKTIGWMCDDCYEKFKKQFE